MHIAKRLSSVEKGEGIDFATAEAMAFGSLLLDGYNVRLCGQDSGRVSSAQCFLFASLESSVLKVAFAGYFLATTRDLRRSKL
jgi:hypothetical protein